MALLRFARRLMAGEPFAVESLSDLLTRSRGSRRPAAMCARRRPDRDISRDKVGL